jgi:flagellar hook-associated protein 3 FlgL
MQSIGLGDLSRLARDSRANSTLRTQLATLSAELASGQHADRARALGADLQRLAGFDHMLARGQAFVTAAQQTDQILRTSQTALQQVDTTRSGLTERLMTLPLSATAAFRDIVGQLNSQLGDRSLFAGTATGGPALAPADLMLAALDASVAGAMSATALTAAVDAWFAPGGGFDTMGYLGDTGAPATRPVDDGESVTLAVRADDPALRATLRATALAAMAGATTALLTPGGRTAVLTTAREDLLAAADGVIALQAALGQAEEQTSAALARHAARANAWGIMRTDLLSVDPYVTATQLKQVENQLDTHLTLTARLSNLSLTRYLR